MLDSQTSRKTTVLVVVDDEPDMRLLIHLVLSRDPRLDLMGHEATSAAEAIELARDVQPAAVILDHGLEGDMTGLEAAPLIKALAPATKIVLFSAYDLAREAARERAVDAFVPKTNVKGLLPAVNAVLGLEQLR